jgi:GNAT superfamily N-acetyltransferase
MREDVATAAFVLGLAFADEPAMRHMHPAGDSEQMRAHIALWLDAYWDVSEVWMVSDLAAAWWITPAIAHAAEDPGQVSFQAEEELLGADWEHYWESQAVMNANHPGRPRHWYLVMIGARPDVQGTGLGSQLMAPVLAHCDREDLPIYAERADLRNQAFYERLGFTPIGEFHLPRGGPRVSQIWRDPSKPR